MSASPLRLVDAIFWITFAIVAATLAKLVDVALLAGVHVRMEPKV